MNTKTTIAQNPADQKYFDFLVGLRDSGITNRFGASPYLHAEFEEITLRESQEILIRWMESF
jgi:hypothetical protein